MYTIAYIKNYSPVPPSGTGLIYPYKIIVENAGINSANGTYTPVNINDPKSVATNENDRNIFFDENTQTWKLDDLYETAAEKTLVNDPAGSEWKSRSEYGAFDPVPSFSAEEIIAEEIFDPYLTPGNQQYTAQHTGIDSKYDGKYIINPNSVISDGTLYGDLLRPNVYPFYKEANQTTNNESNLLHFGQPTIIIWTSGKSAISYQAGSSHDCPKFFSAWINIAGTQANAETTFFGIDTDMSDSYLLWKLSKADPSGDPSKSYYNILLKKTGEILKEDLLAPGPVYIAAAMYDKRIAFYYNGEKLTEFIHNNKYLGQDYNTLDPNLVLGSKNDTPVSMGNYSEFFVAAYDKTVVDWSSSFPNKIKVPEKSYIDTIG